MRTRCTSMNRLFVIGCVLASGVAASASMTDLVKTDAGLISGTTGSSADVRVFKGIPFAAPPVGPLRWRPPRPLIGMVCVRRISSDRDVCRQDKREIGVVRQHLRQQVKTVFT
jgi:carboxylesterase type B